VERVTPQSAWAQLCAANQGFIVFKLVVEMDGHPYAMVKGTGVKDALLEECLISPGNDLWNKSSKTTLCSARCGAIGC
jgi:hypothetical protein